MRRLRGGEIGMVFQEPMASLSPMYTVGDQLVEAIRLHLPLSSVEAREKAIADLRRVGIPQPELRVDAYPFQLSGGMNQRAMTAIALACSPRLLIADEPTTALDVTTQAQILDLLKDLQAQTAMSVMFITHDLGVVAEIADEVAVMYLGSVVERGTVEQIFDRPQHPYTRALLESIPQLTDAPQRRLPAIAGMVPHPTARPSGCPFHPRCPAFMPGICDTVTPTALPTGEGQTAACHLHDPELDEALVSGAPARPVTAAAEFRDVAPLGGSAVGDATGTGASEEPPLLNVSGLVKQFPVRRGFLRRTIDHVRAVEDVSLSILARETVGLVGESGCGKTTLGRCIARAIEPTAGTIAYRTYDGRTVDLAALSTSDLRPFRHEVRVIFQDPFSSLNPRMTLLQIVGEPLRANGIATGGELERRVARMLSRVGLSPKYMDRFPHAFSGGERQRVNIARALILEPRLVIADEPVSALDVSVRAQILNLLRDLQDDFELTYLFISHDLSVVESICDRVAVMYLGKIVELADTAQLYSRPRHPYTEALLSAVPRPDPRLRDAGRRIRLADDLPDPSNPPPGCYFHTRCPYAVAGVCDVAEQGPALTETTPGHPAACLRTDDLSLAGVEHEPA
jgi:peptide/nickel transport system ATP-binding protein